MIVNKENILSLIPQRPPFVMIDGLMHSDDTTTRTVFAVREDNIFIENGQLTEPALVENIAQTAAARAGHYSQQENLPVMVGYIGAIKDLEIFNLPKISDTLETEIVIKNQIFDVTLISGTVRCKDVVMAQCEMKIFIIQPK
jgi:predicted hotdog family 3-hydroxylacyl-ACP dehydratase